MRILLSITVLNLCLALLFPVSVQAQSCLSKEFSTDMGMLSHAYDHSRILGWGLLNHTETDRTAVKKLAEFLKERGNDERLKYIFIEYAHGAQDFLARLSVNESYDAEEFRAVLGSSADDVLSNKVTEFSEIFNSIFPVVRAHNKNRAEKLIIVPINYSPSSGDNIWSSSWDRENLIRAEFEKHYQSLQPTQKAIVLYHTYHLTRNVTGKTKSYQGTSSAFTWMQGPISWMGQTRAMPAEEYKQVVFDTGHEGLKSIYPSQFLFSDKLPKQIFGQFNSSAQASDCLGNILPFTQAKEVSFPGPITYFFNYVYRSELY